jgi:hypothetical protein
MRRHGWWLVPVTLLTSWGFYGYVQPAPTPCCGPLPWPTQAPLTTWGSSRTPAPPNATPVLCHGALPGMPEPGNWTGSDPMQCQP